jgi:hypothetical protein
MDGERRLRQVLRGKSIRLHYCTHVFDKADAFVNLSRDNKTVEEVYLCPFTYPGDDDDDASGTHRYAIWDKIAEGIGNLQALREITIWDGHVVDNDCP